MSNYKRPYCGMTNKTLSEQICEVCGIEPKYLVKYTYFGQQENIYETFEEAKQEKEMLKGEIEEAYPVFENKNFAKLFKMITTLEGFSFRTGFYYIPYIPSYRQLSCLSTPDGEYESESIDPIKAFLTCVFKCVVKEKDTANFIKQEQWEL